MIDGHTSHQYDVELQAIRSELLQMGELVQQQLQLAIASIVSQDRVSLDQCRRLEDQINQLDIELNQHCCELIAKRQPAAMDLRFVLVMAKITSRLEQIGNHAHKVVRTVKDLQQQNCLLGLRFQYLESIAQLARNSTQHALDAFAKADVKAAVLVIQQDQLLNQEFDSCLLHLLHVMMADPRDISAGLDLLLLIKGLERVGDHAKAIAEQTIYMVHGHDLRHLGLEKLAQYLNVDTP